jgi:ankyrin repeat protein
MEQISNALSPKVKPVICATSVSSVKNYGPAEICGRLWFNEVVGKGQFAVDADRYALRPVIHGMIERRKRQALAKGTAKELVWFRTLTALTTTILAGTNYDDPDASMALDAWLAKMKFESVLDGASSGHTPLRYAVIEGRLDLVQQILDADPAIDVNAPLTAQAQELQFNMMVGMTVLHQAAMSQHGEVVGDIIRLLLSRGAEPRTPCSAQNWTALHLAVTCDARAAITALMDHDRSLHLCEIMAGPRPFQRCAIAGQPETMRWCIERYGDIILPELPKLSNAGMSWALASVFEENQAEMLELLLEHGAQLNIDDGSWMPTPMRKVLPLRLAFLRCIVPLQLQSKHPNALIEHFGSGLATTPLHAAAITGNLRSLKVLIKGGQTLEPPGVHCHLVGCTPLHCAAMGGHQSIADELVAARPALLAAKDNFGNTPSFWAEKRGHLKFASHLRALEEAHEADGKPVAVEQVPPLDA